MNIVCAACAAVNRVPDARLAEHPVCGRCKQELHVGQPVPLDDARFGAFIAASEQPVLVDFWAAWCGPCQAMAPQFERAAALLPQVRFAKVDTDANPKTSVAQRIRSIPTLALFHGGREVARQAGAMSAGDLVRWVQVRLGGPGSA